MKTSILIGFLLSLSLIASVTEAKDCFKKPDSSEICVDDIVHVNDSQLPEFTKLRLAKVQAVFPDGRIRFQVDRYINPVGYFESFFSNASLVFPKVKCFRFSSTKEFCEGAKGYFIDQTSNVDPHVLTDRGQTLVKDVFGDGWVNVFIINPIFDGHFVLKNASEATWYASSETPCLGDVCRKEAVYYDGRVVEVSDIYSEGKVLLRESGEGGLRSKYFLTNTSEIGLPLKCTSDNLCVNDKIVLYSQRYGNNLGSIMSIFSNGIMQVHFKKDFTDNKGYGYTADKFEFVNWTSIRKPE